jgi:dephospho-CoA kinase
MKVLVFGNSGSGKSTYARALAAREGLAHLDSDSIVWGEPAKIHPGKNPVQRPDEAVAASLKASSVRRLPGSLKVATAN